MQNTDSSRRIYWRTADIVRAAVIVLAIIAAAKLLMSVQTMLFITFLGILFGLAVSASTDFLQKYRVPRSVGAAGTVLAFLGLLVGFVVWTGPTVKAQYNELRERLPQAVEAIDNWIAKNESGMFGKMILKPDQNTLATNPDEAASRSTNGTPVTPPPTVAPPPKQRQAPPPPAPAAPQLNQSVKVLPESSVMPPAPMAVPTEIFADSGQTLLDSSKAAQELHPPFVSPSETPRNAETSSTSATTGSLSGNDTGISSAGASQELTTAEAITDSLTHIKTLGQTLARGMSGATQYVFPVISSTFAVITGIFLILFLAIYFAIEPNTYKNGFLALIPKRKRQRWDQVLSASGVALKRWLITQLIAMLVIGVVTTITLLILGVPAALPLGILAGLFEFIPTIGPILSAVPSIAMGFTVSPEKALVVTVVYIIIQFVENNFLIPILMKEGVDLPPVVTIVAQSVMAFVFGFMGLFVAVPVLVFGSVLLKMLYIEDVVEKDNRGQTAALTAESPAIQEDVDELDTK